MPGATSGLPGINHSKRFLSSPKAKLENLIPGTWCAIYDKNEMSARSSKASLLALGTVLSVSKGKHGQRPND